MLRPLSNDRRLRVVTAIANGGMSRRSAARRFGVAPSTAINLNLTRAISSAPCPAPYGQTERAPAPRQENN